MERPWIAVTTSTGRQRISCNAQHLVLGIFSSTKVLDRRRGQLQELTTVLGQSLSRSSAASHSLLRYRRRKLLRKEGLCPSWAAQMHKPLSSESSQGQLQTLLRIFCMDEGENDFSVEGSYSDGDASSGGSLSGYTSGSEFEPDLDLELTEEAEKADTKKPVDLTAPLYKASNFQKPGFPTGVGQGILVTIALFVVLASTVVTVDSYIWRVIRRPLAHYFLTMPFLIAAATSAYLGCLCVPLLERVKAHQVFRKEGPKAHLSKVGTPTMGGLFFVPVGIAVARIATGFYPFELWGVCVATLAFAAIGLLDDGLTLLRKHNYGLPGSVKFLLQSNRWLGCLILWAGIDRWLLVFGLCFGSTVPAYNPHIKCVVASYPPGKTLVPLPPPFGLCYLGKWYFPLTAFCFAAMSNGVNLTDGLDGLAAGTCAAAYIGMAVAVLPIFPSLGIFGASMGGACIGFLAHNRYKAKVFMGDTGSLALGGGLAAMAACSGMFLPLFIASGVFFIETVSVMAQVLFFKVTKKVEGKGRRLLQMAPFHHHLELLGWKEPYIIAAAYAIAYILAIAAAHVGLISA